MQLVPTMKKMICRWWIKIWKKILKNYDKKLLLKWKKSTKKRKTDETNLSFCLETFRTESNFLYARLFPYLSIGIRCVFSYSEIWHRLDSVFTCCCVLHHFSSLFFIWFRFVFFSSKFLSLGSIRLGSTWLRTSFRLQKDVVESRFSSNFSRFYQSKTSFLCFSNRLSFHLGRQSWLVESHAFSTSYKTERDR